MADLVESLTDVNLSSVTYSPSTVAACCQHHSRCLHVAVQLKVLDVPATLIVSSRASPSLRNVCVVFTPYYNMRRRYTIDHLDSKGNYSTTSNNTTLVHLLLMGGLLHLVQRGGLTRAGAPPGFLPAPSPLLAVPNVTAHPSTASVPITVLLYNGPLWCGFNPLMGTGNYSAHRII